MPASETVPPAGPSDAVRSVVSFLLFLHLFALAIGILSRTNPSYPAPLEARLREVPGVLPYIALLGFDWPYTFVLFGPYHTGEPDFDFRFDIELKLPDGSTKTVVLPDRETMKGEQRHRYEQLVNRAVMLLPSNGVESRIPEGIARELVTAYGATGGTIRIRGKTLPMEEFQAIPAHYPENPMYEAKIIVAGSDVSLFKIDSATDSAPASRPKTGSGS